MSRDLTTAKIIFGRLFLFYQIMKLLIKKRFTYATIGVYFLLGGIEYGTEEIISQYLYFVDTLML